MMEARAIAALNAMKAMGISVEKVKTVLRNLLQVCENNWEYIEAGNYRVLADAIFEWEESQEDGAKTGDDNVYAGKADVESDEFQLRRPRARLPLSSKQSWFLEELLEFAEYQYGRHRMYKGRTMKEVALLMRAIKSLLLLQILQEIKWQHLRFYLFRSHLLIVLI